MTSRPQTFVEHSILQLDASRGIRYASFEEFWNRRMEPLQFISPDAKGPLAHVRNRMKDLAREQWELFQKSPPTADGTAASLPQAGGAQRPLGTPSTDPASMDSPDA